MDGGKSWDKVRNVLSTYYYMQPTKEKVVIQLLLEL